MTEIARQLFEELRAGCRVKFGDPAARVAAARPLLARCRAAARTPGEGQRADPARGKRRGPGLLEQVRGAS